MHKIILWGHHSNNEIINMLHYVRFDETSRNVQLLCFCSGYSRSHNSTSKCLNTFKMLSQELWQLLLFSFRYQQNNFYPHLHTSINLISYLLKTRYSCRNKSQVVVITWWKSWNFISRNITKKCAVMYFFVILLVIRIHFSWTRFRSSSHQNYCVTYFSTKVNLLFFSFSSSEIWSVINAFPCFILVIWVFNKIFVRKFVASPWSYGRAHKIVLKFSNSYLGVCLNKM